jgi:hypothetical protein
MPSGKSTYCLVFLSGAFDNTASHKALHEISDIIPDEIIVNKWSTGTASIE